MRFDWTMPEEPFQMQPAAPLPSREPTGYCGQKLVPVSTPHEAVRELTFWLGKLGEGGGTGAIDKACVAWYLGRLADMIPTSPADATRTPTSSRP